jgi:hypothetical protein
MRLPLIALFLVVTLGLSACTDEEPSDTSASPSASASSGSETSSPSETAASDLPPARDACTVLDPEEVGRVLGAPVESVVAGQGCRFANPDDPDTTSLGINQVELAQVGGIDGAKTGIRAVVEGEAEDVDGVGDGAFVVVGPTFGGTTPTGGGAVALGSSLVQITVLPVAGATDEEVRRATVDALTLIAERARR